MALSLKVWVNRWQVPISSLSKSHIKDHFNFPLIWINKHPTCDQLSCTITGLNSVYTFKHLSCFAISKIYVLTKLNGKVRDNKSGKIWRGGSKDWPFQIPDVAHLKYFPAVNLLLHTFMPLSISKDILSL